MQAMVAQSEKDENLPYYVSRKQLITNTGMAEDTPDPTEKETSGDGSGGGKDPWLQALAVPEGEEEGGESEEGEVDEAEEGGDEEEEHEEEVEEEEEEEGEAVQMKRPSRKRPAAAMAS